MRHIVMTSSAHMPSSCKGRYRNVAIVQLTQEYTAKGLIPKMISEHARGVLRVVRCTKHSVGKTEKCSYQRALKQAETDAQRMNDAGSAAELSSLWTMGGSA